MNEASRLVVLGAGGHAAVVIEALLASGAAAPHAVLDIDQEHWGEALFGVRVIGGDDLLPALAREGISEFVVGIGSIKDCSPRRRAFERACGHGLRPRVVVHPQAIVAPSARVGAGAVVLCSAVVNTRAVIGANAIVNTGAIVEHDCVIGDHAHVATGARLAGGVRVCIGAHVGIGAVVREGIRIAEGAVVGAGAVVVRDVQAQTTVVGSPARPLGPAAGTNA